MSTQPGGIVSPITLDGVQFDYAGETEVGYREPARALPETVGGGRREERVWWGTPALLYPSALVPEQRWVVDVTVRYGNLRGEWRDTVDELMAVPGEHELAVWKPVTCTWLADGTRGVCWAPWTRADELLTVPTVLTQVGVATPRIKVGRTGTVLTVETVDTATINGTPGPDAGEVWWEEEGQRFRLEEPPASGERIYCRWYPILRVYRATGDDRRRYTGQRPLAEPRDLLFVGAS